jgi:hypothetical protein
MNGYTAFLERVASFDRFQALRNARGKRQQTKHLSLRYDSSKLEKRASRSWRGYGANP